MHKRVDFLARVVLFLALLAVAASSGHIATQSHAQTFSETSTIAPSEHKILVLRSYGYGRQGPEVYNSKFFSVLFDAGMDPGDVILEYLDLNRNRDTEFRIRKRELILHQYLGKQVDLIVAVEQPALIFLLEELKDLAPEVPVMAINATVPTDCPASGHRFLQKTVNLDFKGTLERALELFPNTRRVVVVTGDAEQDLVVKTESQATADLWKDKLEFEYTDHMSMAEIQRWVANLPRQTIVIYRAINRDRTGQIFVPYNALLEITKVANAPVFGLYDNYVGATGVVGGSVYHITQEAECAARIALAIMEGSLHLSEPLKTLPSEGVPMFDWQQIKRWEGDKSRLPTNSIFVKRPSTLWGQYKAIVISIAIVFLLMATLITSLFIQNRRRKVAETLTRKSEERYRSLLENQTELVCRFIPDGTFTFVNDAYYHFFDKSKGELVGKKWHPLPADTDVEFIKEKLAQLCPSHQTVIIENRVLTGKGEIRWMQFVNTGFFDNHGNLQEIQSVGRDITERKQAEEDRHNLQAQLSNAMELARLGHWEYDIVNDLFLFNDHFYRIFGTTAEQVGGYSMSSAEYAMRFVHPDDMHMVEEETRKAIETDSPGFNRQLEHRMLYADGQMGYISVRFFIVKDSHGRTVRTYGVNQDITERKRAEEALWKSEKKHSHILKTAMDGFWLTDTNGKLIEVNETYCQMSGYSEQELLSMSIWDLDANEDPTRVAIHSQKVIHEAGDRFETRHHRKDGIIFDVEVSVQFSSMDGGRFISFLKDITERKQTEASLRDSEALFRNLVNGAPEGIFVQAEGRFLFLNLAMVQIFGAGSAAELIGTNFMERIAPEYHEAIRSRIRFQGETGKPVPLMDQIYLRVDGSRIPVETTAVAIQYQGHGAHLVFVRDITERKKQEETLQLQSLVLDQICDLVTITDMDGVISYVNQAQTKVLGYGKEALIGHSTQIFGEDPLKVVSQEEIVEKTVKNGIWRGEVVNFDKLGQEHIMDCRTQVVFNEQGAPMALCGIATDVTDYKRSEKALLESEVKFRTLVNQAPAALFLHDIDGNIIDVNKATLNHYGYTLKQLLKMKAKDIDPDFIEREDKGVFWKQLKEKQSIKFEGRHRRSDGSIFPVSVSLSPIVLKGKNHIFALAIDMTDYKNAQEKLIESEERFRTVFEQAAVGVARVSTNGGFQEINDKFCQLVGYEKHELYQKTFRDITHPDDLYLDENYIEQVLTGKINAFDIEKRYIHKDGHPVWVRLYSNVIRNIDGEIKYAVAVVTDISERKLVEEEREKLQNQLNQAQKLESIGNLAGGIAHDFNNILFPIVGMSEMLLEDLPPGSPERENAGEIYKAGIRGSDLVKQILAFSRQSEHKLIPTRIQNVLKEVLKLSRASIPSYIEIDQNIQQDCGMVMADPSQIHQIGMNIITNAFHAVEAKGGKISVQLREAVLGDSGPAISNMESGKYAVLSISDTGHGMSEELIGKIFDPYFTTKEQGKGTGLGLAIVYGIIKEHGGHIKVHSEIGEGTTFNVYLPMMDVSSHIEAGNAAGQLQTGSERILLVDDEQPIANLEKQILERLGYKVTMCVNSLEALEVFKANPDLFDLVLSDMTMPQMTGDRLACKLIAIRPDIPIIICTGFSERLNQEKAEVLGIKGFLMKPVVKSDMAKMVRNVLDDAKGSAHA